MENGTFFDAESIPLEERLDMAAKLISSVRDSLSLAVGNDKATYDLAMGVLEKLDTNVYNPIAKLIRKQRQSQTAKYYKETAEILSASSVLPISPIHLVEEDIKAKRDLLRTSPDSLAIQSELHRLEAVLKELQPIQVSEHKCLEMDFHRYHPYGLPNPVSQGFDFRDFKLSNEKILRLRLYHPDKAEHITGTDLVYEQYDLRNKKVRFVHLQYKMWHKGKLYIDDRSERQLERQRQIMCEKGYCNEEENKSQFRFPFCSAFIRPTYKFQQKNAAMTTAGIHMPICLVRGNSIIKKSEVEERSVNNEVFEQMFNSYQIGSRWIPIAELDDFYKTMHLDSNLENIRILAQRIPLL
jgi:hypothetical protein